jgi:hypothetical protein
MRKFIINTFIFYIGLTGLIAFVLFSPSPKTNRQMHIQKSKDSLLVNEVSPRILFIGGSNLTYGLDSQLIKDSLGLNPINTAIHAGIGLKYMLRHNINYVREGDVIIIAPEYQQFYGDFANGESVLLSLLFEVSYDFYNLDLKQSLHLLGFSGEYLSSKLKIWKNLKSDKSIQNDLNSLDSYNAYGDINRHWSLPKPQTFTSYDLQGNFNYEIIKLLLEYKNITDKRKATLYITFPSLDDLSFNQSKREIKFIESILVKNGFKILGTPEKYSFNDSLIFNTSYHLTGKGANLRTLKLINDLKNEQYSPPNHKVHSSSVSQ